jgi:Mg/Co/Ni transporter MgtE
MHDPLLLPELREMLIENDARAMQEFCEVFHPGVVAENLEDLSTAECWSVLSHTNLRRRVEVFEFFALPRQMELVATLDKQDLSALLETMASDDRVALL